jgi:hypothetical protein
MILSRICTYNDLSGLTADVDHRSVALYPRKVMWGTALNVVAELSRFARVPYYRMPEC